MNTISNYKKGIALSFLLILVSIIQGCGVYSFTGASIAPDVKTVTVQFFPNYAALVQPSLSQAFTDKLKEKFMNQTSLALVTQGGDLLFEGSIVDYNTRPQAIQAGDVSALNRLTVTVKVKFTNNKDPKQNFETNFSRFADYPNNQSLPSVEVDLIRRINEQLVTDIFNKSVVNW